MTDQCAQQEPQLNLDGAVTPGAIEIFETNRSTVTLIYINMHVDWPHYCQGTAS